jgi:sec-independent protein translocase protein TatB
MFDIGWSELLVIGVVALLVVGPKELPTLLRTVGKYVGMMRRQATEFRTQFDDAMRDSELEKLKEEMEKSTSEATQAIRDAEYQLDRDMADAREGMDASLKKDADKPDFAEINEGASDSVTPPAAAPSTEAKAEAAGESKPAATAAVAEGSETSTRAANGATAPHATT